MKEMLTSITAAMSKTRNILSCWNAVLKVSNDVRRLSIDFGNGVSQTVLAESFPERMINVTHLDIGIFLGFFSFFSFIFF